MNSKTKAAFIDLHALYAFPTLFDPEDSCFNPVNLGLPIDLRKKNYNVVVLYDDPAWEKMAMTLCDNDIADTYALSPEYVEGGSYTGLTEFLGLDPKRSYYALGRQSSADMAREEGLKSHYVKIRQPFALIKEDKISKADRKDRKRFDKLVGSLHRFDRRLETGLVHAVDFPRLLALDETALFEYCPNYMMDVLASRAAIEMALGWLCCETTNDPAIDQIPHKIDFGQCRRLEIRENKDDMRVCLCDDSRGHNVLYQTAIKQEMWESNRKVLFFATDRMCKVVSAVAKEEERLLVLEPKPE